MKRKTTSLLLVGSLLAVSLPALSAVLMSQWTEGNTRFCKYSDGTVVELNFGEICPATI